MDCSLPGSSIHGFSRQEYWITGCHFLLQGIFLTQGSNQVSRIAGKHLTNCLLGWILFSLSCFALLCSTISIDSYSSAMLSLYRKSRSPRTTIGFLACREMDVNYVLPLRCINIKSERSKGGTSHFFVPPAVAPDMWASHKQVFQQPVHFPAIHSSQDMKILWSQQQFPAGSWLSRVTALWLWNMDMAKLKTDGWFSFTPPGSRVICRHPNSNTKLLNSCFPHWTPTETITYFW